MNEKTDLPKKLAQPFSRGECFVEKFRGQTHIYIPPQRAEKISDEEFIRLSREVFPQSLYENYDDGTLVIFSTVYRDEERHYASLTLPPVIGRPFSKEKLPYWDVPEKLFRNIMELS